MYLILIFQFSVFLSAQWETNKADQGLFRYTICRLYRNTHNIKKLVGEFWRIFFYLRKCDFLVIKYRFSHDRYIFPVQFFLHEIYYFKRINLTPILDQYSVVYIFDISYQLCGRRTRPIKAYFVLQYVDHIKTHIISKNWLKNFGEFFFI